MRDWARSHSEGFDRLAEQSTKSTIPTKLILRALGGNGSESVCSALLALVESDVQSIRYHLAGVCNLVDTTSSRRILSRLVEDEDLMVALRAIEVLSSFSSPESSDIRVQNFRNEDRYHARIAYLEGLFRNPDDRFSEVLPNVIENETNPTIQFYAVAALELIDPALASSLQVEDEFVSSICSKLNLTGKGAQDG